MLQQQGGGGYDDDIKRMDEFRNKSPIMDFMITAALMLNSTQ
ncbi:hypothetical protein [Paenibacillus lautus]|nr:hypothetical protein [Paenibacillus lautus]